MDTKKLRQKILDLAIRGKLVPQDPNDEPASVLLQRIRAEKERLIAEGKIKRPKKPKASSAESHYENLAPPFEIPDSWEWTNIGELLINRDAERIPVSSEIRRKQVNKIYDYYGAAGVIDKVESYLFNERLLLIGEDGANLLSRSKDNAFFAEGKYWVNNHAHILDSFDKSILDYVAIVINSYNLEPYITGSAQPKLSQDNLNRIPIPLPPLEEQKRIMTSIYELSSILSTLKAGKREILSSVESIKSKILDLAMQGKLVEQDHNDEPAADMLRRINPKAKIITDNPHYPQLPDNWAYISLEDINEYRSKSITPANNPEEIFELYSVPTYPTGAPELLKGNEIGSSKQLVMMGDVLVCKINPHINRVWHITKQSDIIQIASSEWITVRNSKISSAFLKYYFESPAFRRLLCSKVSGVGGSLTRAQPAIVKNYLIPIPPLKEQFRIVKFIDEVMIRLKAIESTI